MIKQWALGGIAALVLLLAVGSGANASTPSSGTQVNEVVPGGYARVTANVGGESDPSVPFAAGGVVLLLTGGLLLFRETIVHPNNAR